jgi:hypothetical protein
MTDIEMARLCAKHTCRTAFPGMYDDGKFDDLHEVRSAVEMHAMRQTDIDALKHNVAELVEALRKASDFVPFDKIGRGIRASFQELISKHGGAL